MAAEPEWPRNHVPLQFHFGRQLKYIGEEYPRDCT
jgi:hypothetical protein